MRQRPLSEAPSLVRVPFRLAVLQQQPHLVAVVMVALERRPHPSLLLPEPVLLLHLPVLVLLLVLLLVAPPAPPPPPLLVLPPPPLLLVLVLLLLLRSPER
jgi:hypothetical protein